MPLALTFTEGCQSEKRELLIPTEMRSVPSTDYRESELIPGSMASLVSSGSGRQPRAYSVNSYAISEGQVLYSWYNCVGCHGHGGGGIGPALMDRDWIYGDTPKNIYESIARGRPNGMPAWGTRLPEYQVWYLVAYVRSLGKLEPVTSYPDRQDSMEPSSLQPRRPSEELP